MSMNLIPSGKRQAVSDALQAVFATTQVDELSPLRGGLSSALVCRAVVGGRACLLRIEMARDAFRDPARHYACMGIAAEAGLAPALRFADATNGVAIIDFIEARPLAEHPGGLAGIARELAGLLARLQATPVFPPLVDYLHGVDAVIANMLALGVLDEAAAADHIAGYRRIREACSRLPSEPPVSGHNDLNPSNILYDGRRLWLIDWESAFATDPHVDLAAVANFFGVRGEVVDTLLGIVFGRVDDARRARFALMREISNMFYAAMMLNLVAAARPQGAPPIADLSAPALDQVRQGLGAGTVDIASTEGQLLFAKALLNQVRDSASIC